MRAVHTACVRILSIALVLAIGISTGRAQCPVEATLQSFTGGGATTCPCFVAGEQAGAVLEAPAAHYPIEILRVGIGWGSQLGGTPQTQEQAIHVYAAGLPNPGTPVFTLPGPLLSDGFVNEYNLEPYPGEIVVSGPFTVTLEFMNSNSGNIFAASVVHDGNGCQPGKNVVETNPAWNDACALGVTGDWVFYAIYRRTSCATSDAPELLATSSPAFLLPPQPNPSRGPTRFEFVLRRDEQVRVAVYDVGGRRVADLADRSFTAGRHTVEWNAADALGAALPPGVYVVQMQAGDVRSSRKLVLAP